MPGKFQFTINHEKSCTDNTMELYKRYLNKITTDLGYNSVDDLVEHHEEIIAWIPKRFNKVSSQKQFLAAIFYMLNRKEYDNAIRIPYVMAFNSCKNQQVKDNKKISEHERNELLEKFSRDEEDFKSM